MIDPDAPSNELPSRRHWRHWLIVNIRGRCYLILGGDVEKGTTLTEYAGPTPGKGTGIHRYVFLLLKQTGQQSFPKPTRGRGNFSGIPRVNPSFQIH